MTWSLGDPPIFGTTQKRGSRHKRLFLVGPATGRDGLSKLSKLEQMDCTATDTVRSSCGVGVSTYATHICFTCHEGMHQLPARIRLGMLPISRTKTPGQVKPLFEVKLASGPSRHQNVVPGAVVCFIIYLLMYNMYMCISVYSMYVYIYIYNIHTVCVYIYIYE